MLLLLLHIYGAPLPTLYIYSYCMNTCKADSATTACQSVFGNDHCLSVMVDIYSRH